MESFKVGEAPWEKEELPQEFAAGSAPWEVKAPAKATRAPVVEETHPDVSFVDRAVIKNFAQSPEAGAAYLNKKGFETEIRDGNLYVRKPNEKSFKALDPSSFELQDITDIGYDVAAGLGSGAATALGGIVGNIPGAVASGAAASGGLEALRQKIGQYAGIPQDVSGKDVLVSTALGGTTPMLLGSGATAKQIAKEALKSGMTSEAVAQGQRGLVTKGIEKFFPYLASASSGKSVNSIKSYIKNKPEVDALIKEGPDAASNLVESMDSTLKNKFFEAKKDIGQKLNEAIVASDKTINRDSIFAPLEERYLALAKSQRANTASGKAEMEALRGEIDSLKEGLPADISAEAAWELQDRFKQMANFQNVKGTFVSRYGKNATGAEKLVSDASANAYRIAGKQVDEIASTAGLKSEYKNMSRLQDKLQKYFKDPETTERTLMQLDAPSKGAARKTVKDLEKAVGDTGIKKTADVLEAYGAFQNPELLPVTSKGTTSTSRTLSISGLLEAMGGLGGEQGSRVGRAAGNFLGGPAAVKGAINTGKFLQGAGAAPARTAPLLMTPWLNMKRQEGDL